MNLVILNDRKSALQESLKQVEQSFHIVTGHIAEVEYQIKELMKGDEIPEAPVLDIIEPQCC